MARSRRLPGTAESDSVEPGSEGDHRAFVARANPIAKLAVALLVPLALVLTIDPVTAGVALGLELLALPWCGVGPAALVRTGRLVLFGATSAGLVTALLGADSGKSLGVLGVSTGSATDAGSIALRVLAIGLPGVVLVATTDSTELADALAQIARLPARFVLSALAALRLLGVLGQEWWALTLARRARGLQAGFSPAGLRLLGGQVFALLVLAIRRATVLATAMEARGFGTGERTWARPSVLKPTDAVVIGGGLFIAVAATTAGILF
ncbi:energy-coupling factor transporter transmembrane component T family protein [Spongisporangium articulatum]|uniref:Energy-coupling factor transporter transmembrane component T family protein n=1 Tax=Spongisporangium articulatum TaxID=3362603 RepID=A0ABW8AHI1_9ACTN